MSSSNIPAGAVIIDDSTPESVWAQGSRGLELSERPNAGGFGYGASAMPYPSSMRTMTMAEIKASIRDAEKYKSRISDMIRQHDWGCKDQGSTNYCWAFATVYCLELAILRANQTPVRLSPASVAAQIKGYRNVGGWGGDALKWLREHGAVPQQYWPERAIERRYATQGNQLAARKYRATDWIEVQPRNMMQAATMVLSGYPISAGFNWWGHQVAIVDALILDGELCWGVINSWGPTWGDKGYGVLRGRKAVFDDAVCPIAGVAQ